MAELVSYGVYLPYWRLDRTAISQALGSGGRRGTRVVASYDEDTTSLAVEAGRRALNAAPEGFVPDVVVLATTWPTYLDKTNATAVHAGLGLPDSTAAFDMGGSVRSAMGALLLALTSPLSTLVICSDIRTGRPGSADENDGGDGAVALAFSPVGEPLLTSLGTSSVSAEFLDRWRQPGEPASHVWEERFGESAYTPLGQDAFVAALKAAALTPDEIDHVVVTSSHARAARSLRGTLGLRAESVVDDLSPRTGYCGAAHGPLMLANVLESAGADDTVVLLQLADGADAAVFRTTPALEAFRGRLRRSLAQQVDAGNSSLSYATFLNWRGWLEQEPPRRPDPPAPAAPVAYRREKWKFGLTGSRCDSCGTRHLPPARVCMTCHAPDQMSAERLAETQGTVATFAVDHLAYSPSPPLIAAVIDLDGGGRFACEMTDATPADMHVGARVEFTFRRLFTAGPGISNYFWKARPIRGEV